MVRPETMAAGHLAAFGAKKPQSAGQDRPILRQRFNGRLGSRQQWLNRLDWSAPQGRQFGLASRPV